MKDLDKYGMFTKQIHAGHVADTQFGSAAPPIYQTSTFAFDTTDQGAARFAGAQDGYIYTRIGNPTTRMLEDNVAALEGGCGGLACASGMAAVNVVYFTLLGQGDHMVSSSAVYGPSRNVMEKEYRRFGIESSFVHTSSVAEVEAALRTNTKLLYIETPSNPTIDISDIAALSDLAHRRGILVAVDNTFCSPHLQNPLKLGADIVLHSTTKFINGHTDVVGGVVVAKAEEVFKRLRSVQINLGGTMDPHQAWLVYRGLKTLGMRVERAQENAMRIAKFLEDHPKVKWVRYPGLESHPHHELAKRQMRGFGALMSFEVEGGLAAGKRMLDNIELITLAVSLGGVESLIQHPASMTHAGVPADKRLEADITDGLIRFSVGCEDGDDLVAALGAALDCV